MNASAWVQVRIDPALRLRAAAMLDTMGLKVSRVLPTSRRWPGNID